ncbi:D-hexose-6-phosphate mutarotase [Lysobacter sp. 5GHs7-4]|uniref:D-hexose-6-phosphate mutarotase n=1 Tax=Lysobacter sp. 5GHs7-4 TaxID=2904253 RepID=UPI001E403E80|nr:D-hexose-6-phosphate mutarotase [Lysobacter sp. 5GHs7-4]UHQ22663.1 D-hexose-6-phosphate mutarotase [Lysobacter sp. 5GHs7-4]
MSGNPARVRLQGPDGAQAWVSLQGGQVLSWICAGRERLYLSPHARYAPGQAIRGGVPVIFPQFSDRGPGPRHGFARTQLWTHAGAGRFLLRDDDATRTLWPHRFEAELSAELGRDSLAMSLRIANTGHEAFEFGAALHTYLRLDELARAGLIGLGGRRYLDATRHDAPGVQHEAQLSFAGEVDRLYPDAAGGLTLHEDGRRLAIRSDGFPDTVVWNPGERLAADLADLGAGEHRRFVCVEAAAAAAPLRLEPGQRWQGSQTLTVQDPH